MTSRVALLAPLLASLVTDVHCGQAPQARSNKLFQTVPEIIAQKGYPVEVHHVQTRDGYILELHRIPGGRGQSAAEASPGRPVLVMHGLLGSSAAWVLNPRQSLGFALADQGYDVWLGNDRGNRYSRKHVQFNPNEPRFWTYTFDSLSKYDNPAMMDYILETTGHEDLYYIGFSSSTMSFWATMNHDPSYNDKVRLMIAMGPLATWKYFRSIMWGLVPIRNIIQVASAIFTHNEFLRHTPLSGVAAKTFCHMFSPLVPMCALSLSLKAGWDFTQLDKASIPLILSHIPAGAGSLVVHQFLQNIASGQFQHYDFGKEKNLEIYGQRSPPQYYPEKVTAPVVLLWGYSDKLSDRRDVAMLAARLPNLIRSEQVSLKSWQHSDFMWGVEAGRLAYSRVLHYLEQAGGPR